MTNEPKPNKYRKLFLALAAVLTIWAAQVTGIDQGLVSDTLREVAKLLSQDEPEPATLPATLQEPSPSTNPEALDAEALEPR